MKDRRSFDAAFPVYIRYLGSVLGAILILAPLIVPIFSDATPGEVALAVAGGYPLATGMVLYKTAFGGGTEKER